MIPIIYDLAEAARILGFSESYLRSKLRDRTFAGMKRAGRWAMTEAQIEAAIESMCIDARPADPQSPAGVIKTQPICPPYTVQTRRVNALRSFEAFGFANQYAQWPARFWSQTKTYVEMSTQAHGS